MADNLLEAARQAKARAYAPYSTFPVGAAVEVEDGTRFTGVNVENASYGLCMCAERVAIFRAVAAGYRRIERIAISTGAKADDPDRMKMPCGACRQVMAEFMGPGGHVLVDGVGTLTLNDLLPRPFQLEPPEEG